MFQKKIVKIMVYVMLVCMISSVVLYTAGMFMQ
ncbi:stressosome-associated protein Prli42 [Paenibacillus sp. y28]